MDNLHNLKYFIQINGKNKLIEESNFFIPPNKSDYLFFVDQFLLKKDYHFMNKFCKNNGLKIENLYDEQNFMVQNGRIISFGLEWKLENFPNEILKLDSLRGMNISNNYIKKIPWNIDNLYELNYIYADSCYLEKIPGSFLYMNFNFLRLEDNNLDDESLKIISKLKNQGLDVKI